MTKYKTYSSNKDPYDRSSSDNRYNINSNSKGLVQIIDAEEEKCIAPTVFFTPTALKISHHIVAESSQEVAWMALTKLLPNGDILITDNVYIPKQTVTGVTVTIDESAMMDLAIEVMNSEGDTADLLAHFHSHVNMGTTPSTQDNAQIEEYFDSMPPFFVRGILNKSGNVRVDVFYPNEGIGFNDVHTEMYIEQAVDLAKVDELLKSNISKEVTYMGYHAKAGSPSHLPTTTNDVDYEWRTDWAQASWSNEYGIGWTEEDPIEERPLDWRTNEDYLECVEIEGDEFEDVHAPQFAAAMKNRKKHNRN